MSICYSAGFPGKVYTGLGSFGQVLEIVEKNGCQRVLILTDRVVAVLPAVQRLTEALKDRLKAVITEIPPEPPIGSVQAVYEQVKEQDADLLIAVGGGSVMDMTKIVAAAAANRGFADSGFTDTGKIKNKGILTVMAPTTAGTGAEATPNAIFLFPEQDLKVGICDDAFVASYVILDPELTKSLPKKLTASTGIDALCHAVESYLSTMANPISRTFSLRAAGLISENIEKACENGEDMEARENMLLGSFFAGMCLFSSTTVAVHALSYPLGGKYHIPHGVSNAILLPLVMEANLPVCAREYGELAKVMLPNCGEIAEEDRPKALVDYLYNLCERLEIPKTLSPFGIRREDLDTLTDNAFEVKRLLGKNPKKLTREEIYGIYERLL